MIGSREQGRGNTGVIRNEDQRGAGGKGRLAATEAPLGRRKGAGPLPAWSREGSLGVLEGLGAWTHSGT